MAKRKSYTTVGGGGHPRANWWKKQLGTDYYSSLLEVYSEEYQAVLDRATTEGFTAPDSATSSALDTFLAARVADGSFDLMDRLFIPGLNNVGLENFARISLKNPATATLATLSGVYGLEGITPDGVSTFANTGFNPSTQGVNYIQDSASRGYWLYTDATVGNSIEGYVTSINNRSFNLDSANHRINSGNLNATVSLTGTGYKALNRSSSTNVQVYNGLTKSDRTATSNAVANENMVIGRSSASFSNPKIAMFYAGGSLTETMHNNIRNDFATFLTAIGL